MRRLFLALLVIVSAWVAQADSDAMLLWMVDDTTTISGPGGDVSVSQLVSSSRYSEYADSFGARIHVTGGGVDEYLTFGEFIDPDSGETYEIDPIWLPNDDEPPVWSTGKQYANVNVYKDNASVAFMIELGVFNENDEWLVLAQSETASYQELQNNWYISPGETSDPRYLPWTGGHYSIPEPTSGLLILFGGALLALRRKRLVCDEEGFRVGD